MKLKRLLLTALVLMTSTPLFAALDTKGTDFWIAIPPSIQTGASISIYITSDLDTTGNISIPGTGFSQNYHISANSVSKIALPISSQLVTEDTIENMGINISALNNVQVFVMNYAFARADAFIAIPSASLGNSYMVLSYSGTTPQFVIVAIEDITSITLTATSSILSKSAGTPYIITMNEGQSYVYGDSTSLVNKELTGSLIYSDKPIALISGNYQTAIPSTINWENHIVEQLPPTITWGKEFLSMPFASRAGGDTFRFLAKEDNTAISINGSNVATLNAGQFHEQIISTPSRIISSKAILAMQFANGNDYDPALPYGDPTMMLLVPTRQFMDKYVVYTPDIGFPVNYLNIIAPDTAKANISLDSVNIPASQFTPIASSGYSGCRIQVNEGVHVLSGPQDFGVYIYGFDSYDAYGFPGGYKLEHIDGTPTATATITETPTVTNTPTITPTHTITPTATVTATKTPGYCMELKDAYPNPANNETNIVYRLCRDSQVNAVFYTVSGEIVREITQEGNAGYNRVHWDCRNNRGKPVASGVFLYSLEAVSGSDRQKIWGKVAVVRVLADILGSDSKTCEEPHDKKHGV